MKISKNGQYALVSAADLAMQPGLSSIASIACRQGIDKGYLGQILLNLKNAGIVSSVRGKSGGYYLSRSSSLLTAGEVVRAVEGELKATQCSTGDGAALCCASYGSCVTRALWQKISREINNTLDSVTIADILEHYMKGSVHDATE